MGPFTSCSGQKASTVIIVLKTSRNSAAHFSVGQVVLNSVELLRVGDTKKILPGRQYMHSLFHLDRPSATITIRNHGCPSAQPQYNYLKPYFATDPFFKEVGTTKKLQSAGLLLTIEHQEADALIGDMLSSADFQTAFALLESAYHSLTGNQVERLFHLSSGQERYDKLLEKARARHGQLVDLIQPVFDEAARQNRLVNLRGYLKGGDQRYFLALLLNVPRRDMILELVKQRFPEKDAVETVLAWINELASTKLMGSGQANILGIENFDETALFARRRVPKLRRQSLGPNKRAFEEEPQG